MDLSVKIGKITLKNPVLAASGTFGFAKEFEEFLELKQIGAIVTKSVTLKATPGNPPPRTAETPSGMLNAIGLQNDGIDNFVKEKLPYLRKIGTPIVVSIAGAVVGDYVALAKRLNDCGGIDGIELNISCPNVKRGGVEFSKESRTAAGLVHRVRKATKRTLITKLSPNVSDISEIALACEDAGSDALSLVNTFLAMAVDAKTRMPKLSNITGGLSGPAIKPIALRMVWEVSRKVKVPLVGMGGIMNAEDAVEFLLCGAAAVAVGTANFVDPRSAAKIIDGIKSYMKENRISRISELIGGLKCQKKNCSAKN